MSNKQAIDIIDSMIKSYEGNNGNWNADFILGEASYRIPLMETSVCISVEERLPDDSYGNVLGYVRELNDLGMSYFIDVIHYNMHLKMWMKDFIEYNVTHWMPLPTPPINK